MDFIEKVNTRLLEEGNSMKTGNRFFLTWIESNKAEMIENMLDERNVPIEMLPTPEVIRDQVDYVMVCKDAFQVLVEKDEACKLNLLNFPAETRCFDGYGTLIWEK
jgi:hypothetical protein